MPPTYSAVIPRAKSRILVASASSSVSATMPPATISSSPSEVVVALGLAGREVVAPHVVGLLRVEEHRQPAVGELGGHGHVLGPRLAM
jgi:hypothetical protein